MIDLTGMTPVEAAKAVKASNELVFAPFDSGTVEMKLYLDELLGFTEVVDHGEV